MDHKIYTIGYGNRSMEIFTKILKEHQISCLLDIRSKPYSKFKTYNTNFLAKNLSGLNIEYVYLGKELGGYPEDPSCYNNGIPNYPEIETKSFYLNGIQTLIKLMDEKRKIVIMCSELKYQGCHRHLLVGKSLATKGIIVEHINEKGNVEEKDSTRSLF